MSPTSRDYTPSPPGTPDRAILTESKTIESNFAPVKRVPTGPAALRNREDRGRDRARDDRYRSRSHSDSNDDRSKRDLSRQSRSSRRSRRSRHHSRSPSFSRSPSTDRSKSKSHRYDRRDSGSHRSSRRDRDRDYHRSSRHRSPSPSLPVPSSTDRDRRTVFVQQLAARLRTRELFDFFSQVGDVCDASIVRDKVTNRSKGVAYVEFAQMESVARAIQLTGNKLLGIPVIVQHTESEKNRLALEAAGNPQIKETAEDKSAHIPAFNTPSKSGLQIYVGNIYFGITEEELKMIFQAFGEIEYVNVQRDETGRSKGYAFVKYRHEDHAKEALLKMNGFVLAGRNLKVGVGVADKNAASMIQSLGNSFVQNTHTNPLTSVQTSSQSPVEPKTNEAMESAKPMSREALMRKLMREDDNLLNPTNKSDLDQDTRPVPIIVSRCVALQNMFDPSEESGTTWTTELLEDVKAECEAKYGKVVHIQIDAQSPKGEIFAKFDTPESAKRALEDLNGRYFGGKQISATSMVEMVYTLRFPKSKDL